MRRAVGGDEAVEAERAVVRARRRSRRRRRAARVPSGRVLHQRLVDPVPHEAALEPRVGADGGPVLVEVAARVAHGVDVLAHDQRPRRAARASPTPRGRATAGYIGAITSDSRGASRQVSAGRASRCAMRLADSRPRTAPAATGRTPAARPRRRRATGDQPLSLPSDHTMTDGWFSSRSAMRVTRSRIAGRPLGLLGEAAQVGVRLDVGLVDHVHARARSHTS